MVKQETYRPLPPDEIIRRIEKALKTGGETHTWEDIRQGLQTGAYQMFWNDGGVLITQIHTHPQCRTLHCFVAAGDMVAVLELQKQMVDFAVTQSCKFITAVGRLGWEKVLPHRGWKKKFTAFQYDLEGVV